MDGIYLLANDRVFEWTAAALANLRAVSPLPVMVIPFDDNITRTCKLARRFGASVLDLEGVMYSAVTEAGRMLYPQNPLVGKLLRKVVAFDGPYERFFFADVDQIFITDVPSLVIEDLRADPSLDVVAGWCDPGQTWATQKAPQPGWSADAISMNTGLWGARSGILSPDQLLDAAKMIAERAWQFDFAHATDQPIINVALSAAEVNYAVLNNLHPDLPKVSNWSGHHSLWLGAHAQQPISVHWAGQELPTPTMPAVNLYLRWRLRAPWRLRGLSETLARGLLRR